MLDRPPWAVTNWSDILASIQLLMEDVAGQKLPGWCQANNGGVDAVMMFLPESSIMSRRWAADMRSYHSSEGDILLASNATSSLIDGHVPISKVFNTS